MSSYGATGIAKRRPSAQRQANFDRAQLDAIDWDAVPRKFGVCAAQFGLWKVWTTEHVAEATCYVSTSQHVLALHPTTWATVSFLPDTMSLFLTNFTGGASGMKFLAMDSGPYAEAARLEAEQRGGLQRKDALDSLAASAQSLIVQASGLASAASPQEIQIFSERYAEIQRDLEQIEDRLARVRSLVDLAGDTVMGACS